MSYLPCNVFWGSTKWWMEKLQIITQIYVVSMANYEWADHCWKLDFLENPDMLKKWCSKSANLLNPLLPLVHHWWIAQTSTNIFKRQKYTVRWLFTRPKTTTQSEQLTWYLILFKFPLIDVWYISNKMYIP